MDTSQGIASNAEGVATSATTATIAEGATRVIASEIADGEVAAEAAAVAATIIAEVLKMVRQIVTVAAIPAAARTNAEGMSEGGCPVRGPAHLASIARIDGDI